MKLTFKSVVEAGPSVPLYFHLYELTNDVYYAPKKIKCLSFEFMNKICKA